jgi:hypothetical protein
VVAAARREASNLLHGLWFVESSGSTPNHTWSTTHRPARSMIVHGDEASCRDGRAAAYRVGNCARSRDIQRSPHLLRRPPLTYYFLTTNPGSFHLALRFPQPRTPPSDSEKMEDRRSMRLSPEADDTKSPLNQSYTPVSALELQASLREAPRMQAIR